MLTKIKEKQVKTIIMTTNESEEPNGHKVWRQVSIFLIHVVSKMKYRGVILEKIKIITTDLIEFQ